MAEDRTQVWLVDRTTTEKPTLINHVYATPDGERYHLEERSTGGSEDIEETTAAMEVPAEDLSTVEDEETKEQYAAEAERMTEQHDPDDVI